MADVLDYTIHGDDMQLVEIGLDAGEGFILARLTGSGTVYLQSLPFSRLTDRIMATARFQQRDERTGVACLGGNLLGGLLQGDRNF